MIEKINQHALKSLSCFAAVTFFSLDQICSYECFISEGKMSALYFSSTLSKPLFFLIMGYLDELDKLSKTDVLLKIRSIGILLLFWNVVLSAINSQHIHHGYILQNGILLGMGVIYLSYPLIIKCIRDWKFLTVSFIFPLVLLFSFERSISVYSGSDLLYVSNYSFIWVWATYYIVGHILGEEKGLAFTRNRKVSIAAKIMALPVFVSFYYYDRYLMGNHHFNIAVLFTIEHAHLFTISLILFILFDNMVIKKKIILHTVEFISPAMVGVYIVHNSVFFFLKNIYDFNDVTLQVTLLVIVFIISVVLCRILLLNRFTSKIVSF